MLSVGQIMSPLTDHEKQTFLMTHLRHRLTLLRTLRERKRTGESYQGRGDIYRCVKDSNLIAVRLLLDFMGLKGVRRPTGFTLEPIPRRTAGKYAADVKIDQFIGHLLTPRDVPVASHDVLAAVYCRADKELAHLTTTSDDAYNTEDKLIEAATAVESLLEQHLFRPLGVDLPEMDE
jgi:hypothetical protein